MLKNMKNCCKLQKRSPKFQNKLYCSKHIAVFLQTREQLIYYLFITFPLNSTLKDLIYTF